jgi:predicted RNase H-like nuclease (RuvC/YqgF family)
MLTCVRWYLAYALSLRNLEEMMQERGVFVDHSTIHRWIIKLTPVLEEAFRKRKRRRAASARSARAGAWTKRTSRFAAKIGIGTARWINKETLWISY